MTGRRQALHTLSYPLRFHDEFGNFPPDGGTALTDYRKWLYSQLEAIPELK